MISNRMIENTIRQIRESQAEKEKTKEVRQKLDEFKRLLVTKLNLSTTDRKRKWQDLQER